MGKNKENEVNEDEGFELVEIGDQVKHAKWGVGTVLFRSGTGDNAKAIVVFPDEGQKKLMLKYAKLKKVGTTSLKSVERMRQEAPEPPRPKAKPVARVVHEEIELDVPEIEEEEEIELDEEVVGFDDTEEEEGFGDRKGPGGE